MCFPCAAPRRACPGRRHRPASRFASAVSRCLEPRGLWVVGRSRMHKSSLGSAQPWATLTANRVFPGFVLPRSVYMVLACRKSVSACRLCDGLRPSIGRPYMPWVIWAAAFRFHNLGWGWQSAPPSVFCIPFRSARSSQSPSRGADCPQGARPTQPRWLAASHAQLSAWRSWIQKQSIEPIAEFAMARHDT